ncbi:hypothetical protein FGG08_001582 [Glutinoglossum americanum]|uniref:RING-type domain-containing protein n=1 Tax=Glutinoglossum americanum TaxID=1670608 RepID=A0A9P8L588_9PEZI|nr:hypothetical protein FGG08_001582 [Glutinoglossum americanum]
MVLSALRSSSNARRRLAPVNRSSQSDTEGMSANGAVHESLSTTNKVRAAEAMHPEAEDTNIRTLNDFLTSLAAIFPDIQLEVFREMLTSFDEESKLHVVTEALLKHKTKWVQGRWRVPGREERRFRGVIGGGCDDDRAVVPVEETFRSESYKRASRTALSQEFRGLSRSTINAVLAEHNYSYTLARPTLLTLSSKSWRFSLSSFFLRRKAPLSLTPNNHPLISYHPSGSHDDVLPIPALRFTESPELDQELFDTLLAPLQSKRKEEQEAGDHELAMQLNEAEAEERHALHDCECCFVSTSFEQLSMCDDGGHFICHRCVRYTINESLFGQGWGRNIRHDRGSLRCLAPMVDEGGDCNGSIPQDMIRRALLEEKGGGEVWRRLEERLAGEGLSKSGIVLVRCPFCIYAEVDEIYLPTTGRSWTFKRSTHFSIWSLLLLVLGIGMISLLTPFIILYSILTLVVRSAQSAHKIFSDQITFSLSRTRRKRRGLRFNCLNPLCCRSSCLSCSKEWHDIHICFESERTALRSAVERAMAEAVKRTCPRCNLSFIKASGCNKLTCVCGYAMCYVCRADIGKSSYRHFCEHFRPDLGKGCTECEKCDLYKCEDEEVVIRRAAENAEKEWIQKEGMETLWRWEGKETVVGYTEGRGSDDGSQTWAWRFFGIPRAPTWLEALDWVIDQLFE